MMTLQESYKSIKRAIVAFCPKYIPVSGKGAPLFPPIIGTGFVVREDGLIATNDHVMRAFAKAFRPPGTSETDWGIYAMMLYQTADGQLEVPLEVLGVMEISKFVPGRAYYGPKRPDLALVHVKAKGLPFVSIADEEILEGKELATAGFPMGTDALTAPGYVHQITPTLQRGIVSAVLPFACRHPHAFTLNVMTQGGASGSPVFDPDTTSVVGVLYAGLNDFDLTRDKDVYRIPTNISYIVPGHFLTNVMEFAANQKELAAPSDAPTIEEMIASREVVDVIEKGRQFEVKEIKMKDRISESVRLTEVNRDESAG